MISLVYVSSAIEEFEPEELQELLDQAREKNARLGVTGLLVPPGDPGALAAGLDNLLDNPGMRYRMGAAGNRHARQFTAAEVTTRVLEVFEDAKRQRVGLFR